MITNTYNILEIDTACVACTLILWSRVMYETCLARVLDTYRVYF